MALLTTAGSTPNAAAAVVALNNPGFESPVLQAPPGTTFQNGATGWAVTSGIGTTYEVPWLAASPAPEGQQYAYAPLETFDMTQVLPVTLDTAKTYTFTIDVFPLEVSSANNMELAVDVYDTTFAAYNRQAYATYHPSWLPLQEDFLLVPQKWNRLQVRFAGADIPGYVGQAMRVRVSGRQAALDRAQFEEFSAGEYPAAGGTSYYISNSQGSDANAGTSPAAPWKSFNNINAALLLPGDKVFLLRGDQWTEELHLRGQGAPGSPIELAAYGDTTLPRPRISRSDKTSDKCVVVQQPSYWKISGLDCRQAKLGLYLRYHNSWDNKSVEVRDCHFEDMDDPTLNPEDHNYEFAWSDGIWVGGHIWQPARNFSTVLDGLTVENCSFYRVAHGYANGWYYPPVHRGRIRNFLMQDCTAIDCLQGAFALFYTTDGFVRRIDSYGGGSDSWAGSCNGFMESCSNVAVHDSSFAYCDRRESADGVGFDFEGNNTSCSITNSLFHHNSGSAVIILSTNGPNLNITLDRNTFYNNGLNPWNSEINAEVMSGSASNTGAVSNCGFYRRDTSISYTSPSNFGGFTLTNNRFGTYDPPAEKRWWNFDTPGDLEGWNSFNDWQSPAVAGGVLSGASSTGFDPFAQTSITWVNTRETPYVWLRMSHTQGNFAQIFYTTESDPTWSGDKLVSVPVVPDGIMRDYWVDLRSTSFRGVVTQLRLDPPFTPGNAPLIDHFRVTGSTNPAQAAPVASPALPTVATFESIGSEDGQVLESSAGSGTGGSFTTTGNSNPIGDTSSNQRSRMIFSFDTSSLPDNAAVVEAQLRFTRTGSNGDDPWTFGGSLKDGGYGYADIASQFGASTALSAEDWEATALANRVAKFIIPYSNGLSVMDLLTTQGLAAINRTGRTQFRLYTDPGTNNDNGQDTISVGSGSNTTASNRPQLKVRYYTGTAPTQPDRPDFRSDFSPSAQLPRAPQINNPTDNTLTVTVLPDTNGGSTEYAIYVESMGQWVQSNGALGANPVWRTAAAWGNRIVSGLSRSSSHVIRLRARRADGGGETANGPAATLATLPVQLTTFAIE